MQPRSRRCTLHRRWRWAAGRGSAAPCPLSGVCLSGRPSSPVQFTIAVVNADPKKSKYSDTLHRFCKKEHDWGWKKFIELSKVRRRGAGAGRGRRCGLLEMGTEPRTAAGSRPRHGQRRCGRRRVPCCCLPALRPPGPAAILHLLYSTAGAGWLHRGRHSSNQGAGAGHSVSDAMLACCFCFCPQAQR